ncbi:hypothetical protein B4V02_07220 [Paenibacillus kribbensis]|uniref:Uncharacterized protein n=1 Tax=Paenibacillus kribbensis TaxID=172713 RepID=A0A222WKD5_9BACL|nr:hypothetical protein [Paenibacillus kribbensis]ASR46482.1 hypothetical protein B4V02_07220 [Paenibacillus kribbensis]
MEHSFSSILTYSIQTIAILLIILTLLRKNEKKIGWGSLSLLLSILGMAVSFKFGNYIFGDQLLSFLGLPAWSNADNTGFHYTFLLSIIFFAPSLIIGYKNPDEFGALIGKWISSIYLFLIIISLLFFITI